MPDADDRGGGEEGLLRWRGGGGGGSRNRGGEAHGVVAASGRGGEGSLSPSQHSPAQLIYFQFLASYIPLSVFLLFLFAKKGPRKKMHLFLSAPPISPRAAFCPLSASHFPLRFVETVKILFLAQGSSKNIHPLLPPSLYRTDSVFRHSIFSFPCWAPQLCRRRATPFPTPLFPSTAIVACTQTLLLPLATQQHNPLPLPYLLYCYGVSAPAFCEGGGGCWESGVQERRGRGGVAIACRSSSSFSSSFPLVDYGRKQGRDSPREAWEKWTNFF